MEETISKPVVAPETFICWLEGNERFGHFIATDTVRGKAKTKSSSATKKLLRVTIDNELRLEKHINKMSLKTR